jgi:hypothetical protein
MSAFKKFVVIAIQSVVEHNLEMTKGVAKITGALPAAVKEIMQFLGDVGVELAPTVGPMLEDIEFLREQVGANLTKLSQVFKEQDREQAARVEAALKLVSKQPQQADNDEQESEEQSEQKN